MGARFFKIIVLIRMGLHGFYQMNEYPDAYQHSTMIIFTIINLTLAKGSGESEERSIKLRLGEAVDISALFIIQR